MLTVETIGKIRLARSKGASIRKISKDLRLSRNTVREVLRSGRTEVVYKREHQPFPRLGPFLKDLERFLEEDEKLPKKRRRSCQLLFEELSSLGYEGGYDSVRRYTAKWRQKHRLLAAQVFIPLSFAPGEAFQFDWSQDTVELSGKVVRVNVAHARLCHSRMFFVAAYPRQSQEMLFDAHRRAFEFFGGVCDRGIYDNPRTMVTAIQKNRQRTVHPRFARMCSHYLFEPDFCNPASGWEKGQVENQVGLVRRRFFTPRPKFKDLAELNAWLADQCLAWSMKSRHPDQREHTVFEVFQEEKPHLIGVERPFDGYSEEHTRASSQSLVRFDRNRYSVQCAQTGRPVQVRAYAEEVVLMADGREVGRHARAFGRDKTIYDPWHYLPALARKPGALRNGAPFADWDLPRPLRRVRARLARFADGNRQFVAILSAVADHGLSAVAQACREGLAQNAVSREVILNLLHRGLDKGDSPPARVPAHLALDREPAADCGRYDLLLKEARHDPR